MDQITLTNNDNGYFIDDETPIFRYMSIPQLLFMVEYKAIHFSKISNWIKEDPFEGESINHYINSYKELWESANNERERNTCKVGLEVAQNYNSLCFGSSWTIREESDAMWRIYSWENDSLRIKTSVGKLRSCRTFPSEIKPLYKPHRLQQSARGRVYLAPGHHCLPRCVNKVIYGPLPPPPVTQNIERGNGMFFPHVFFHKRKEYDFEEEVRLIVQGPINSGTFNEMSSYPPQFDVNKVDFLYSSIREDFIEEVVIHPRAKEWVVSTIEKYCQGKSLNCKKSRMCEIQE